VNANPSLSAPHSFTALFDPEQFAVLGELQEEGDAGVIAEVVQEFLADAEVSLQRLDALILTGDHHACSEVAHSLKGGFATFGMMRAHGLALEIEHQAQLGLNDSLAMLCRATLGCFMAGKRALLAHMERERCGRNIGWS
jgi:HPt (histidine-containing phosphotransfer) domain-containing protein